ncbi:receptor-like protein 33 [Vitis vinifera]|uniref:receptor-like protein 33 n=1 Tax=Vitis vinifera TaxID=29760 RepID=UPI0008FECE3F|nr:receptor-like protein 33 [Vitis vinifera]|eukprot:XP_019071934.1 PREDICTED: receptor like protein 30-like [Vitis vinifera]
MSKLLLYFLFFLSSSQLLSTSFSFSNSTKLCPGHQSRALLHLRKSFSVIDNSSFWGCDYYGVTSYPKTESWKKGSDCCSWDGVTCDRVTGHVIGLDLSCSWLYGTIHSNSTLFLFPHLRRLNLAFNDFNGSSVSTRFGRFSSLTHLNLSESLFSGLISPEISHLANLVSLDLSGNGAEFAPHGFNSLLLNLTKLQKLHLGGISISSVFPNSLLNQSSLISLDLSDCGLHGSFHDHDIHLPKLEVLNLWGNNALNGNFPRFSENNSLLELVLASTNFSGELPASIGNLKLPHCLGNFSKYLSVLNLRRNRFHGNIPQTFLKGNAIRDLDFNDNQLDGLVPRSLIICRKLEVLDLGNNKINDTFPHWLGTLSKLQVLVLRSNSFHGHIRHSKIKSPFMSLRIIDLAHNDFEGDLPELYLRSLKAIMNVNEGNMTRKYMGNNYYQDSIMVTIKGLEIEFVKILNTFTTIDLSSNKFQGEIPKSIGNLNSLRGLNLSHNNLGGHIPSPLGNLKSLESLDLSSNKLIGRIPQELTSLTFLEVLNLSQNNLTGFIPRGNQFETFGNDSYNENSGLCGFPLSKKCTADETLEPSKEANTEFDGGFDWKITLMGYGCGLVIGLSLGCLVFLTGKPEWLTRMVEENIHKTITRSKRSTRRKGARRK